MTSLASQGASLSRFGNIYFAEGGTQTRGRHMLAHLMYNTWSMSFVWGFYFGGDENLDTGISTFLWVLDARVLIPLHLGKPFGG